MGNSAKIEESGSTQWRVYIWGFIAVVATPVLLLLLSVILLRWVDPSVTSFILREDWENLEVERYNLRDYWVSAEEIPKHMKWAVVASEDQLFWEHRGFDMESIKQAWEDRQEGRRSRGASSISQQVAKNLFLSPAHSLFRKGVEAGITVVIEFFWPKERIIEVYLNIAEFGPGIFGIGKATEAYWSIPASELAPEQAARLAAILPNPKRIRIEPPSSYTHDRSRWILRQMTQLTGIQYIRPAPADTAVIDLPEVDVDPFLLEAERELDKLMMEPLDTIPLEPDTAATFFNGG